MFLEERREETEVTLTTGSEKKHTITEIKAGDPLKVKHLNVYGICASKYTDEEYARPAEKDRVVFLWYDKGDFKSINLPLNCVDYYGI